MESPHTTTQTQARVQSHDIKDHLSFIKALEYEQSKRLQPQTKPSSEDNPVMQYPKISALALLAATHFFTQTAANLAMHTGDDHTCSAIAPGGGTTNFITSPALSTWHERADNEGSSVFDRFWRCDCVRNGGTCKTLALAAADGAYWFAACSFYDSAYECCRAELNTAGGSSSCTW